MTFKSFNLFVPVFANFYKDNHFISRQFNTRKSYRVLFFGSDDIALSSLRKLNDFRKAEKIIDSLNLVSANKLKKKSVIEEYAQSQGIKTVQWPLQNIETAEYDIGLIVAFGHLIKDDILNKFPLGMINVHPSLLPRWRGAAPIIYTLLHGDKITGVTLMKIKANVFDVGEIISQQKVPVPEHIKLPELTKQLSEMGAEMLVESLRTLPDSLINAKPQSEEGVTYAKKINKSISEVRWSEMDAVQVYNLYRAIYGLYQLTTNFRDKQIKLFDAFLLNDTVENDETKNIGRIDYCEITNAVKILCKDRRYIYFKKLRIVGKREITALDFYNGYIKNVTLRERHCNTVC